MEFKGRNYFELYASAEALANFWEREGTAIEIVNELRALKPVENTTSVLLPFPDTYTPTKRLEGDLILLSGPYLELLDTLVGAMAFDLTIKTKFSNSHTVLREFAKLAILEIERPERNLEVVVAPYSSPQLTDTYQHVVSDNTVLRITSIS